VEAVVHDGNGRLPAPLRQPRAQAAVHWQRKVDVHGGAARQRCRLPAAMACTSSSAHKPGNLVEPVALRCSMARDCSNHATTASTYASTRAPIEVVAGHCTAERHLQMCVWVDAARHDQLAACIDDTDIIRGLRPSARLLWTDCSKDSSILFQPVEAAVIEGDAPAGLGPQRQ
jgi:hypothetical protein